MGCATYLRDHRKQEFLDNLCRKLLSYALGRTLLPSDDALIGQMRQKLAANDYRFGSLIETIVTSPQFLTKRGSAQSALACNSRSCRSDQTQMLPLLQISRRTLLRGAGVAMALPWLESIPVWGAARRMRRPQPTANRLSQAVRRAVHGLRRQRRITGGPRAAAKTWSWARRWSRWRRSRPS